ncbi:hypothetical protein SO802_019920 [Lithocarpus litseifolius]|uniref:MADF domain-containing protein n=1 Tax=Lithocarpus litseifolius TaxID=425828 RepID=A0AAW2CDL1_9ROSI
MEQLKERDGAIDFFLMTAATNVDWYNDSTDIQRSKLVTIANAVNFKFGTTLDSMNVKVIWAKVRARWETWVRTKHHVRSDKADYTTGTFQISKFTWDRLSRIVLDFEVFRRQPMISPNMVCSVFNCTPSRPTPDEHSNSRQNMSSGGTSSGKRLPSLKEVENEEIAASMRKVYEIDELANLEEYINFCFTVFEDPKIREVFNYLLKKLLRRQYIIKKDDSLQ